MDIYGKAVAQEQDLLQVQVFCWILYWQECRCNTSRSMTSSPPCPTTSQVNRLRKQWIAGLVRSCQSRHMHLEMGGKNLQPYLEMALLSSYFWRLCSPCWTFPFSFPCFCPWFFEHLSPYQTCSPGEEDLMERNFQGSHPKMLPWTHIPPGKKLVCPPKKEPFQKGKASSTIIFHEKSGIYKYINLLTRFISKNQGSIFPGEVSPKNLPNHQPVVLRILENLPPHKKEGYVT